MTFSQERQHAKVRDYLDAAARTMRTWVEHIERHWPDRHHMVLAGGWDSRMLLAMPKRQPEYWHAATIGEYAHLTVKWLREHALDRTMASVHSFPAKAPIDDALIWLSDCMYRTPFVTGNWGATVNLAIAQVEAEYETSHARGPWFVWTGFGGSECFRANGIFSANKWRDFYALMGLRMPLVQGSVVAAVTNYTGWPVLSPFHNPMMWRDVYLRTDMQCIGQDDHRKDLLRRVAGRPLAPGENKQLPECWPMHRAEILACYRKYVADQPGVTVREAVA
jgi:hypothetical protein